jgi:hypothetical protein
MPQASKKSVHEGGDDDRRFDTAAKVYSQLGAGLIDSETAHGHLMRLRRSDSSLLSWIFGLVSPRAPL